MRPLQVYFEPSELARLDAWAKERNWTKSQVVRAAVRALTAEAGADPLLELSGMVQGLPRDLSTRFNDYLGASCVAETAPRYGQRRLQRTRAVRR